MLRAASCCLISLGLVAAPHAAFAQDDESEFDSSEEDELLDDSSEDELTDDSAEGDDDAPTDGSADDDADESESSRDKRRDDSSKKSGGAARDVSLDWAGSLEVDIGLANYEAEDEAEVDDQLYDYRGRFVIGPLVKLGLGSDLFFAATGQVVTWVKNNEDRPLLNADDVWGMFGGVAADGRRLWDVQIGRFEAMPVYFKSGVIDHDPSPLWGQGETTGAFDLFTLEDQGALCRPPLANQEYCVDIYEVNHILLRDEVGSVAFHWFPIDGLAFELHGKYGQVISTNHLGGRAALVYAPTSWLQVSGAAEMRLERNGSPPKQTDPTTGAITECTDCGRRDNQGAGGGIVLKVPGLGKLKPELAANAAYSTRDFWDGNAELIANNSPAITSFGGYAQIGYGDFLVGAAGNNTEAETPDGSSESHLQVAAYTRYALQESLSLKLVLTYAEGTRATEANNNRADIVNTFTALRLRMKYLFNGL